MILDGQVKKECSDEVGAKEVSDRRELSSGGILMEQYFRMVQESVEMIRDATDIEPSIAMILGSGLGALADEIEGGDKIPYENIPHFPQSTVRGHSGQLVLGDFCGKKVIAMQGRFHYYEGHTLQMVTYPVRVMRLLGAEVLIVTNAGGGINTLFEVGDLMIITDHINNIKQDPLRGDYNPDMGPRFVDMSYAYDRDLINLAAKIGKEQGISLRKGIYLASSGPAYETPAEIRGFRIIGADVAGMSTVPEVIVANQMSMRCLGISCITNMAAGVMETTLSHQEVIETAKKVRDKFVNLIKAIVAAI